METDRSPTPDVQEQSSSDTGSPSESSTSQNTISACKSIEEVMKPVAQKNNANMAASRVRRQQQQNDGM